MSEDIFVITIGGGGEGATDCALKPGMLLNILQYTVQPSPQTKQNKKQKQ